jgi:hypothetical protein
MLNFRSHHRKHDNASLEARLYSWTDADRAGRGQSGTLARVVAAAACTGALFGALAVPAAAMGGPNPYVDAQVGLTYPVYQPKTVLGFSMDSFKLVSCGVGKDESLYATYGKAYPSDLGKLPGFSIAEGYPNTCNYVGTKWQVGLWNVGIPKDMVTVRVSVYCSPAVLKYCTTAYGVNGGYVLQWAQPYRFGTSPEKLTQMFIDTSRLTLSQALNIVAGIRPL